MIVFGLILVGLAVLLAAGVAASSGNRATLDVFGVGLNTRASVVFFIGVVTAVALLVGLWLTKAGLARGYRRRKEVRELRHQAKAAPAPVTDISSTRSDRADQEETAEVAAGNDVDTAGEAKSPRHRAADSRSTPIETSEDTGHASVWKSDDAEGVEQKDDSLRTAPRSGTDRSS